MGQHGRADIGGGIDTRNSGRAQRGAGRAPTLQRYTRSVLACAIGHAFATAGLEVPEVAMHRLTVDIDVGDRTDCVAIA